MKQQQWMAALSAAMLLGAQAAGCADDTTDTTTQGSGGATASSGAGTGGSGGSGGGGAAGPWSCLGQVEPPVFTAGDSQITFTLADFPSEDVLADLELSVCALDDDSCAAPLDNGTSNTRGQVTVTVPTDAPYYYRVSGAEAAAALFFRRGLPPPTDPFAVQLGVLSQSTLSSFIALVGASDDSERGHLVITTRDCDAALAAGVRVELSSADSDTTLAYLDGGLPSAEAMFTDASGRAGAINLPVGMLTVTSYRAADDSRIGERTLFIRAGEVSYVGIVPSP